MASRPVDPAAGDSVASLRAERDALARRCADAERRAETLAVELTETRDLLNQQNAGAAPLSLFDGGADPGDGPGDGIDPRIVSVTLCVTAVAAGVVAVLSLLNGNLFTWFGAGMVVLAIGLATAAIRTRP